MCDYERERGRGRGGVKWQRKMSRGRERMIIYSLIRVIQLRYQTQVYKALIALLVSLSCKAQRLCSLYTKINTG